ncbi:putative dsRNA-binding protein [Streptomyces halstedii]|uniref:putative dsRNA-binding protein n=1 Tax=Streptomyces halstedii TaxID=1944 RepID=UPI00345FACA4
MLSGLGGAWLDLLIVDRLSSDPSVKDNGSQSARLAQQRADALTTLGGWASNAGFAHLGRGEQVSNTASVAETMALQLIGALVLTDAHGPVHTLISYLTESATRGSVPGVDWLTLLQERPYGRRLRWTYTSEGPDHDVTFAYTVHDEEGRSATGAGRSKKAARQAAAREFIQLQDPDLVRRTRAATVRSAGKTGPGKYGISDPGQDRAISDLRSRFGLPDTADPWLAQALTHKSWAYEHQELVIKAGQASNASLAHLGAHVVGVLAAYERAREAAVRGLRPAAEEARISSVSNDECRRLGAELHLVSGMLIGRGERQNGTVDHGEDAAQAVLAVAWQHLGSEMLTRRPSVLQDWLTTMDHGLDPSTQVQQLCTRFAIQLDTEWYVRGPDHATERICELTISFAGGERARWEGAPMLGGQTAAKQQACREVLDLLHAHASGSRPVWTENEAELLGVILRRQIAMAPGLSAKEKLRCARGGELGLEYLAAGDAAGFQDWVQRTQSLTGSPEQDSTEGLAHFYADCLTQMRYDDESPLWMALQRAAAGAADESASRAAEAALRTAIAEGPSDVRGVLGAWWMKTAESVHVRMSDETGPGGGLQLSAVEAVAFREVLDWAASAARTANTPMTVERTKDEGRLYVLLGIGGVDVPQICHELLRLLTDVVPSMRCTAVDDLILLHWQQADKDSLHSNSTPLAVAGLSALSRSLPARKYLSIFAM